MKLDQQTLDRLIDDRLMLSEAEKFGFVGTDQEVNDAVHQQFVDPDTGRFVTKKNIYAASA